MNLRHQLLLEVNALLTLNVVSYIIYLIDPNMVDFDQDVPSIVLYDYKSTTLALYSQIQDIFTRMEEVACILKRVKPYHVAAKETF